MVCKATLLLLLGFLKIRCKICGWYVSACWAVAVCRLGEGLISGQQLSSTRTPKDDIRAAFVSGRGAITSRKVQSA
eukprot:scaffold180259_cov19-Tisochrysis_lutea.AAC.1